MRILVTLHNFVPEPCFGAERVAMRQMREMLRLGHEIAVLFAGRRDPSPSDLAAEGLAGVRCYRVPFIAPKAQVLLSIARPRAEGAFRRALREYRPDVVLFHHLVRLSLRLPEISGHRGVPSVLVLHDHYLACPSYSLVAFDGPVCPRGGPARCARCLYATRFGRTTVPPGVGWAAAALLAWRARLVPRLIDAVDGLISPSRSVVRQMEDRGIPLREPVVIPNGADTLAERNSTSAAPGAIRFGYLGAALSKKGIEVLAQACAGSLSSHVRIRGFRDEASVRAFRQAHPDCRASLQLFSPDGDGFFDDTDVVVVPSVCLENQPTTIIEAFARGKPVIASDIGGIPEMFEEGRGGWLVPPGEVRGLKACMERLVDDPGEVRRVAAAIPDWPSWPAVTKAVVTELERAVASRRPRTRNGGGGSQPSR